MAVVGDQMNERVTLNMKVPNTKGVWYMHYISECVLCGRYDETRERRSAPAPPIEERYDYEQYACDSHFL